MGIDIKNLKTEYQQTPLGIDTLKPKFSWQLKSVEAGQKQVAYQIMVASNEKLLIEEHPDMWDSGKVESDNLFNIEYDGKTLSSRKRYYWQVRIWDKNGDDYLSNISWWEMGLLDEEDWNGNWIGAPFEKNSSRSILAPYFRKEFNLKKNIKEARIYISGLGYYELYLNGNKVGDHLLDPGTTDYEERVLYATYDVTSDLQYNSNAIGVVLGRGRYSMTTANVWGWEKAPWHDEPKFILQLILDYDDGTSQVISSDTSWKTMTGAILFDSLYAGEIYDARKEKVGWNDIGFDDSECKNSLQVERPEGRLKSQLIDPIKVIENIKPVKINKLEPGHYIYKFEKMVSGWAELTVTGEAGTEVNIIYGERLNDKGEIDLEQVHVSDQIQTDTYILSGDGTETWEPRFSYKGFRYIEIKGYPGTATLESIKGKVINTAVSSTGDFSCLNELFNKIHANTRRAILNNLHSIPTDTPVFEKNGWTGDAQLTAEAAIYNFDMSRFYRKWLNDFKDSQRENGELPPIVPTSDWGYSDAGFGWDQSRQIIPAWDSAYILISWWYYEYYGDMNILQEHYSSMKKYLDYMGTKADEYILSEGLGDWLAPTGEDLPFKGLPPEKPLITSTGYYYLDAKIVSNIAAILGYDKEAARYRELALNIKKAFNEHFLNKQQKIYQTNQDCEYRQTSNIIPLAFGLVPEKYKEAVVKNLVENLKKEHQGHLDTGILGTKYLLPVLTDYGYVDIAYKIANQRTYPGWGYWIELGATSLYEAWEPVSRSRNHHMFGSVDDWFYQSLAGIKTLSPGFKNIAIKPVIPAELKFVKAEIETISGKIQSNWQKFDSGEIQLDVIIPANVTADIYMPIAQQIDNTIMTDESLNTVDFIGTEDEYALFKVDSGNYTFKQSDDRIIVRKN